MAHDDDDDDLEPLLPFGPPRPWVGWAERWVAEQRREARAWRANPRNPSLRWAWTGREK